MKLSYTTNLWKPIFIVFGVVLWLLIIVSWQPVEGAGLVEYQMSPSLASAVLSAAPDDTFDVVVTLSNMNAAGEIEAMASDFSYLSGNQVQAVLSATQLLDISTWQSVTFIDYSIP